MFATFFKIGAFTFGGGWAMISIIEREIVDKHHWIEREEFIDLLAISQAIPGILAVNIASSIGDRLRGMKGSIAASLGTILPSFLIILAIAIFLTPETIKNNRTLSAIFMGIRPCVVALIIAGTDVGQVGQADTQDCLDTDNCGVDDIARHGHSLQPDTLHSARSRGWIHVLEAITPQTKQSINS